MIPDGKVPGEIVELETPEGENLVIQIPENTSPGSFLQVAYPVAVLPPQPPDTQDTSDDRWVME